MRAECLQKAPPFFIKRGDEMSDETNKEKKEKDIFINLDSLKAKNKKVVQFLGKKFDVSYIPSGISIPLLEAHNAQIKKQKQLAKENKQPAVEETLWHEIKQISTLCGFYEKEFTKDFIAKNATDKQLLAMYTLIVDSIIENFGVPVTDNDDTAQPKKKQTGAK